MLLVMLISLDIRVTFLAPPRPVRPVPICLMFPIRGTSPGCLMRIEPTIYGSKTRCSRTRMLTRMLMVQMWKHMDLQSRRTLFCNSLFEQSCANSPVTSLQCGVESVECGVWSVKCRVWSVECKVRSVKCKV